MTVGAGVRPVLREGDPMDALRTAVASQPVRFNIRIRTRLGEATQQYLGGRGQWRTVASGMAFRLRSHGPSDLVELYDDLVDRGLDVTAIRRASDDGTERDR
jgi:hypothetical protein